MRQNCQTAAGGVSVYVSSKLESSRINLNERDEEIVGVSIKINQGNELNLFAYYNAPDKKEKRNFLSLDILEKISNFKKCILLGDLNSHMPG